MRAQAEDLEANDDALMGAYQGGDGAAFEHLVRRHRRALYGFLRRLLRDDALAEDALIETLYKLHAAAPTFTPQGRFKTFLFTIAYREGISQLRRVARHRHPGDTPLAGGGAGLDLPAQGPSPEAALAQRRAIAQVERALQALPERQRAIFLLYYREGMATPEIASAVDLPQGSVRAYLCMARKTLRAEGVGQGLSL